MRTARLWMVLLTSFALAAPLTLSACGGHQARQAKIASVKPGNLPSGATWDGVYFNPVWGMLHIKTEGNTFKGKWKRADGSAWGEMTGTLVGDVARFEWTEHKSGLVGPSAISKGRGYFRYSRPEVQEGESLPDNLLGQWGFDDAEVGGGEWNAVRQTNVKPDLNSIQGDTEPDVGGWR